jgi:cytochrome P450
MLADPLSFIEANRARHGPVAGLLLGGERVVLVSDPAAARQVLIDDAAIFVKEGTAFFPGSALTGNGLLVSDGAVWKRQRRLSNPAFRRAAVEGYAAQMVSETAALLGPGGPFAAAAAASAASAAGDGDGSSGRRVAAAPDGAGVIDVYEEFNKLTLNITLAALFGLSGSEGGGSSGSSGGGGNSGGVAARAVAAVERAFAFFASRGAAAMVVPEWVPTPDNLEFNAAVRELDDLVYGIISRRRADLAAARGAAGGGGGGGESGGEEGVGEAGAWRDLLQALLEAEDEDGSGEGGGCGLRAVAGCTQEGPGATLLASRSLRPCSTDWPPPPHGPHASLPALTPLPRPRPVGPGAARRGDDAAGGGPGGAGAGLETTVISVAAAEAVPC